MEKSRIKLIRVGPDGIAPSISPSGVLLFDYSPFVFSGAKPTGKIMGKQWFYYSAWREALILQVLLHPLTSGDSL